jgi:hypothetical protein
MTWEGRTLPEAQAAPEETAMRSKSKAMTAVSAFMPSTANNVVFGRRPAASPEMTACDETEQWIKKGKGAIKWTRLSCRTFVANTVRLQLHALAYNLGNFLRTLATPEPIKHWSLSSQKEKLIKIGAKVISHGRGVAFRMPEVAPLPG